MIAVVSAPPGIVGVGVDVGLAVFVQHPEGAGDVRQGGGGPLFSSGEAQAEAPGVGGRAGSDDLHGEDVLINGEGHLDGLLHRCESPPSVVVKR